MVVFRIDPPRTRQASSQCLERLSDIGRNFNPGKKTRHCEALKSRRPPSARSDNQLLDPWQDARHDGLNTCAVRMQAIPLVQFGIGSNAIEEEWIKDDRMSRGKRGINAIKRLRIFRTHVWRSPHSSK